MCDVFAQGARRNHGRVCWLNGRCGYWNILQAFSIAFLFYFRPERSSRRGFNKSEFSHRLVVGMSKPGH